MKWLLLTIFISAEPNAPPGNSINAYDSYKECEEELIKRNDIDEAINGNKAELFKDTNGFTASKVLANNDVRIYRYCSTASGKV